MKKIYKKLTKEQKARGVIFSSCLSAYRTEMLDDNIHEVLKTEDDITRDKKIGLLLDDKMFNSYTGTVKCPWKFNIVRR